MVTQLASVWLHTFNRDIISVTYLAVVAALSSSTLGSSVELAGSGIAAGIPTFLDTDRWVQSITVSSPLCALVMWLCACSLLAQARSNLHSAAVALLSRLQKGISTDWSSIDTICRGSVQQTGGVELLQKPAELLLTAAAEQLGIHYARKQRWREQDDRVSICDIIGV